MWPSHKFEYETPELERLVKRRKDREKMCFLEKKKVQWKPLNVITLGQSKSDNIYRMITITGCFNIVSYSKWDFEM